MNSYTVKLKLPPVFCFHCDRHVPDAYDVGPYKYKAFCDSCIDKGVARMISNILNGKDGA